MNTKKIIMVILLGLFSGLVGIHLNAQTTHFVDASATGSNNGTSWTNAFSNLQDAINAASAGDELWIARGVYKPDRDASGNTSPANSRSKTFYFNKDLKVYGGFAGTETALSQRPAWDTTNATILSGDIGVIGTHTDNAYNVCTAFHLPSTFEMSRITIMRGVSEQTTLSGSAFMNDGNGTGNSSNPTFNEVYFKLNASGVGGAFFNDGADGGDASPTFTDCVFKENLGERGGALTNEGQNSGQSSPSLLRCHFIDNLSGEGGAVYNMGEQSGMARPDFVDCVFYSNESSSDAGAVFNNGHGGNAASTFSGCRFENNMTGGSGAGVLNLAEVGNANATFTNCDFIGNDASVYGGGISNEGTNPSVNGCTFIGNTAGINGGGIYSDGSQGTLSSPLIENCRFEQNIAAQGGGALFNNGFVGVTRPEVNNCWFIQNSATNGGVMYLDGSGFGTNGLAEAEFENCVFSRNSASGIAGGIYVWANGGNASARFTNCSFYGNVADNGNNPGAFSFLVNGGAVVQGWFNNCISWGNVGPVCVISNSATVNAENSIYETNAGFNGINNVANNQIGADPLYVNPAADDLTLQVGSPALNAGNNTFVTQTFDLAGNPRIQGAAVEMGAFEDNPCPRKLFVYQDATGNNDGTSWQNAFKDLQDGIEMARSCNVDTIWVAEGSYFPSKNSNGVQNALSDPANTFFLDFDVVMLGGFNGTETHHSQRDWVLHPTILDGNMSGTIAITDDANHVFTTHLVSRAFELDGFVLQHGNTAATGGWLGGGVYNYVSGAGNESSPTLRNLVFRDNRAMSGGGLGVRATNGGTARPVVEDCKFMRNGDGAVLLDAPGGTTEVTLLRCDFEENDLGLHGEVWSSGICHITIENCRFYRNQGHTGGAIYFQEGSAIAKSLTIRNTDFIENSTGYRGGGIEIHVGTGQPFPVLIEDCLFQQNSTTGQGGAITTQIGSNCAVDFQVYRTEFRQNQAGGNGGAIDFPSNPGTIGTAVFYAEDCLFEQNLSSFNGGAFFTQYASPEFKKCIFRLNHANNDGGALNVWGYPPQNVEAVIQRCEFEQNSATQDGGAISLSPWLAGNNSSVINCTFLRNNANRGGAICNEPVGNTGFANGMFANCVFSQNSASQKGGAFFNFGSMSGTANPELVNCSFAGNTAPSGGAFRNERAPWSNALPELNNCAFWNNGDEIVTTGSWMFLSNSAFPLPALPTSVQTNGGNLLNTNPMFVDPINDDLRLQTGSPALNAGAAGFMPVDIHDVDGDSDIMEIIDVDLDFDLRVQNGAIDMGAYEGGNLAGVEEEMERATKVWPTILASGTELNIESAEKNSFSVRLTDLSGNLLVEGQGKNGRFKIDTKSFGSGLYLLLTGEEVHRIFITP